MLHSRACSRAGGLPGRRGLKDKEHETGCSCPPHPSWSSGCQPTAPILYTCCRNEHPLLPFWLSPCPGGPRRNGEGGHGGRMWVPYMAVRRETAPSLPTLPAGSSAACLPQHLTFSRCPEEPYAEPLLTPRPRASGLKISRLLSPGKHTWRQGRGGWADAQAPSCPAVWVGGAGKEEEVGSPGPLPTGDSI